MHFAQRNEHRSVPFSKLTEQATLLQARNFDLSHEGGENEIGVFLYVDGVGEDGFDLHCGGGGVGRGGGGGGLFALGLKSV